ELALLDWSSGIRFAYCADVTIEKLTEPFKASLIKAINKFCSNATACLLKSPVIFAVEQIVLLDGYPRRDYGAVQFRFVVVLPHNAVPLIRLRQPLLSNRILSTDILQRYAPEISRRLGWHLMSYEKFPRFDAITEFMNIALIPIGFILLIAMFMLAYWSNNFRFSGSSDEILVSGSSGGKNLALKFV
ncbi:unnamed protein product, partial [Dracunculus medinensis]|uniref:Cell division protein FtsK n=1 Tax=Dracunculus medinensis TaxID=318479 RepID=A0A0N4ULB5_DRAME